MDQDQQDLDDLERSLQKTADQWRARLADPAVQAQIRAGTLRLSPLVQQLLLAYPPEKDPPPSG